MSRDASIELDFGDDTYTFRLAWGELVKVQEACNAGPYVVLQRLYSQTWEMNDIREVIRWGLIGGGLEPVKALKLVKDYVEARPPLESIIYAQAVLSAGLMGAPEESLGKTEAASPAERELTTSPTES
ncbi:Phage tail tube protein, GTA-gp10 [Phyllobacterium sp. CL33Tsu]|uniref:gene transfer agent family protein n=1 Tax=Phyllobacterium sp. CL33Tsu TaxID=1798191 RepID=UPI0008EDBF71|nr:gene transfer agent family protein [Phyllobacterium sp. CL33Tsu]SFJ55037.1 Phage tail tube protein, GTA-gp10 [Phyllobacterium sp. CL33Tsu]